MADTASETRLSPLAMPVTYGMKVKILQHSTEKMLHPTGRKFRIASAVRPMVSCVDEKKGYAPEWWFFKLRGASRDTKTNLVRDGDIIRLVNTDLDTASQYVIHSEDDMRPTHTVTVERYNRRYSDNDTWRVECNGGVVELGKPFRLIHCNTNYALHSDPGSEPGSERQKVDTIPVTSDIHGDDNNASWTISEHAECTAWPVHLWTSVESGNVDEAFKLIGRNPDVLSWLMESDDSGHTRLNRALERHDENLIHTIIHKCSGLSTSLHSAMRYNIPLAMVQALLEFPGASEVADDMGNLPLHVGMGAKASVESIQAVLDRCKDAAKTCNIDGETPLHVGLKSNASDEAIDVLVKACPLAAAMETSSGDTPLELGFKSNASKYAMAIVLQAYPKAARRMSLEALETMKSWKILTRHEMGRAFADRPNGEDKLGASRLARAVVDIHTRNIEDAMLPSNIALYAEWGSGKSFVKNKMREAFNSVNFKHKNKQYRFVQLEFNAWVYNGGDSIWAALVNRLIDGITSISDPQEFQAHMNDVDLWLLKKRRTVFYVIAAATFLALVVLAFLFAFGVIGPEFQNIALFTTVFAAFGGSGSAAASVGKLWGQVQKPVSEILFGKPKDPHYTAELGLMGDVKEKFAKMLGFLEIQNKKAEDRRRKFLKKHLLALATSKLVKIREDGEVDVKKLKSYSTYEEKLDEADAKERKARFMRLMQAVAHGSGSSTTSASSRSATINRLDIETQEAIEAAKTSQAQLEKEEEDLFTEEERHPELPLDCRIVRFVIYVDDLDRCSNGKSVEILEAVQLLFNEVAPATASAGSMTEFSGWKRLQARLLWRLRQLRGWFHNKCCTCCTSQPPPDTYDVERDDHRRTEEQNDEKPPFITVFMIDPRIVVQDIMVRFGSTLKQAGINGYQFLDKIVQTPICLPKPAERPRQNMVSHLMSGYLLTDDSVAGTPKPTHDRGVESTVHDHHQTFEGPATSIAASDAAPPEEDSEDEDFRGRPDHNLPETPDKVASGVPPGQYAAMDQPAQPIAVELPVTNIPPQDGFDSFERENVKAHATYLDANPRRIKRILNIYNYTREIFQSMRNSTNAEEDLVEFQRFIKSMALTSPAATKQRFLRVLFRWVTMSEQWPFRTALTVQMMLDDAQRPGGRELLYEGAGRKQTNAWPSKWIRAEAQDQPYLIRLGPKVEFEYTTTEGLFQERLQRFNAVVAACTPDVDMEKDDRSESVRIELLDKITFAVVSVRVVSNSHPILKCLRKRMPVQVGVLRSVVQRQRQQDIAFGIDVSKLSVESLEKLIKSHRKLRSLSTNSSEDHHSLTLLNEVMTEVFPHASKAIDIPLKTFFMHEVQHYVFKFSETVELKQTTEADADAVTKQFNDLLSLDSDPEVFDAILATPFKPLASDLPMDKRPAEMDVTDNGSHDSATPGLLERIDPLQEASHADSTTLKDGQLDFDGRVNPTKTAHAAATPDPYRPITLEECYFLARHFSFNLNPAILSSLQRLIRGRPHYDKGRNEFRKRDAVELVYDLGSEGRKLDPIRQESTLPNSTNPQN